MALQARHQQSLQLLIPLCDFNLLPSQLDACDAVFQSLLFLSHPYYGPP